MRFPSCLVATIEKESEIETHLQPQRQGKPPKRPVKKIKLGKEK